jgi:hypothetical protein
MGSKQSHLESQHRDPAASSIDGTSPQIIYTSLDGVKTMDEDKVSVVDLCNELIRILQEALEDDTGWAWQDLDTAEDLCDVLTDILHWDESVTGIARSMKWPEVNLDDPELEFFKYMEEHEDSLTGVIRRYLVKSLRAVQDLRTVFEPDTSGTE